MRFGQYGAEFGLISATMVVSILGFWNICVGPVTAQQRHHHLHRATAFLLLAVRATQLGRIAGRDLAAHRRQVLVLLLAWPLVVATTAMLSVHSVQKSWHRADATR